MKLTQVIDIILVLGFLFIVFMIALLIYLKRKEKKEEHDITIDLS